jgi:hypothetical protein
LQLHNRVVEPMDVAVLGSVGTMRMAKGQFVTAVRSLARGPTGREADHAEKVCHMALQRVGEDGNEEVNVSSEWRREAPALW